MRILVIVAVLAIAGGYWMIGVRKQTASQNKEEACASYRQMYQRIADIGDRLGGIAQLDYTNQIDGVEISPDGKSATARVRVTMNVAGKALRYRGASRDTLVRRRGRVFLQRSEETATVGGG